MKVKLIALSGIDGSGKSTQLQLLEDFFTKQQYSVINLWTRGGNTPGINFLKKIARKFSGNKLPPSGHSIQRDRIFENTFIQKTWLFFGILDLIRIYSFNIRFWNFMGKIVICDRFLWDTFIDFKLNFPKISFEKWFSWRLLVWLCPNPNQSYLLMIPLKMSEERCLKKYEPFPDTPEKRERRYEMYLKHSKEDYWKLIDSSRSVLIVFEEIKSHI